MKNGTFLSFEYRQKMQMVWTTGQNHRHPKTDEPCVKLQALPPAGHSPGKSTHIQIHKITSAPDHYRFETFKQLLQLSKK